jgi:hypothetical protein
MNLKNIFVALVPLILFSCSSERHKTSTRPPVKFSKVYAKNPYSSNEVTLQSFTEEPIYASTKSEIIIEKKSYPLTTKQNACDIMLLRNGEEIQAKIIEVGINEVKYKKCDNLDGPIYIEAKNKIFKIKYANGSEDVFKLEKQEVKPTQSNPSTGYYVNPETGASNNNKKKLEIWGLIGFLVSLLGVLVNPVFIFLSLIFSIVSLVRFSRHKNKFWGRGFAITGLVLSISVIVLISFLIAILF